MNSSDLARRLADRLGTTQRSAREWLEAAVDELGDALSRGERVTLSGFGGFRAVERAPRQVRHPRTGQPIRVGPRRTISFQTGAHLARKLDSSAALASPAEGASDTGSSTPSADRSCDTPD